MMKDELGKFKFFDTNNTNTEMISKEINWIDRKNNSDTNKVSIDAYKLNVDDEDDKLNHMDTSESINAND